MKRCKIHQYYIKDAGRNKPYMVYACSNCSHYIPYKDALRKISLCTDCNENLVITSYHITNMIKYPKCRACKSSNELIAMFEGD